MAQGRENGQANVIYHLIQRRSRRARPTRRPQSHLPLRWSRICSKYDHQSAACPLEACREDEDCSMRACFMRMSPHPFGHVIAKYWTAATGSNHPCHHSVESAADGRSSLRRIRMAAEVVNAARCGAAALPTPRKWGEWARDFGSARGDGNSSTATAARRRKRWDSGMSPPFGRGARERLESPFQWMVRRRLHKNVHLTAPTRVAATPFSDTI